MQHRDVLLSFTDEATTSHLLQINHTASGQLIFLFYVFRQNNIKNIPFMFNMPSVNQKYYFLSSFLASRFLNIPWYVSMETLLSSSGTSSGGVVGPPAGKDTHHTGLWFRLTSSDSLGETLIPRYLVIPVCDGIDVVLMNLVLMCKTIVFIGWWELIYVLFSKEVWKSKTSSAYTLILWSYVLMLGLILRILKYMILSNCRCKWFNK